MGKKNTTYFSVCVGLIVFVLSYCSIDHFAIALPKYYPTIHVWTTEKKAGVPGMAWYGMFCAASIFSLLAGSIVYYILPAVAKKNPTGHVFHRIFGGLAAASSVFMMLYFIWTETAKWIIGK